MLTFSKISMLNDYLERDLKKADIGHIRFHDLRHIFASLSLENGVDIKAVSYILGHTDIAITGNIYSHVTDKMKQRAAEVISDILTH